MRPSDELKPGLLGDDPQRPQAWVIGATSVLGYHLARIDSPGLQMVPWCSRHHRSTATAHWGRLNVEDPADWAPLREQAPRYLLYCAGVCDVARCEAHPQFAYRINVSGVAAMLEALPPQTRLVYCSSDHVFGGDAGPYTEATPPHPISVYGRTRVVAEGLIERARPDAIIVRVGLPIGPSLSGRTGHYDWLRYRHRAGLPMTIIEGEVRAAVWADAAAHRIVALARSGLRGVRHLVAESVCHRPHLAALLCTHLGIDSPRYEVRSRRDLNTPHLGRVDLHTQYRDPLASPLGSPAYPRRSNMGRPVGI